MESALYYTFSTIAQTLGGAIALLGAFVLYRLQSLNSAIAHHVTQEIFQHYGGETRLQLDVLHAGGKHRELLELVRSQPPPSGAEHIAIPCSRLDILIQAKDSLIIAFRGALVFTVLLTGLAVGVLAGVPAINTSRPAVGGCPVGC